MKRYLIGAILASFTVVAYAASFNCERASSFVEKEICNDQTLGKLDDALSENYKRMMASDIGDGARKDLRATQRTWLGERNKCTTAKCIDTSYRNRVDEICEYPVISGVHPDCTSSDSL